MDKDVKRKVITREYELERIGKDQQLAIGERIRKLREEAGLSINDVADVLRIGYEMMSKLENGRSTLKTEHIFVLAQLYGVSAHYIMFGEDEKYMLEELQEMCKGSSYQELKKVLKVVAIIIGT